MKTSTSFIPALSLLVLIASASNISTDEARNIKETSLESDAVHATSGAFVSDEDVEMAVEERSLASIVRLLRSSSRLSRSTLRGRKEISMARRACTVLRKAASDLSAISDTVQSRSFFRTILRGWVIIILWCDYVILIILRGST